MKVLLFIILLLLPVYVFAETTTLTWTKSPEDDLNKYTLYRGLTACTVATTQLTFLKDIAKELITYTDSTIPAGTREVCYELTASDVTGNESTKSNRAIKTFPLLPPPTNFKYVNGKFSWDSVSGAVNYLLRVHVLGTPYTPCETIRFCGTVTALSLNMVLVPDVKYDAWIHSVDSKGVYGLSQGILITIDGPPKAPQGFIIQNVMR